MIIQISTVLVAHLIYPRIFLGLLHLEIYTVFEGKEIKDRSTWFWSEVTYTANNWAVIINTQIILTSYNVSSGFA